MIFNINQIIPERQEVKTERQKSVLKIFVVGFLALLLVIINLSSFSLAYAIVDPLTVSNNHFGIHLISATDTEASSAAELVNSSGGDWGYVTVLIPSNDRDHDRWQSFFNSLRRYHLIPLVRLATQADGGNWKLPYEGEEADWANFLDSLIWPTQNRYVIVYNEPNQGHEWEGSVDPKAYAQVLDKTITALKSKNPDFFILNAGFDSSAPSSLPSFEDEVTFLKQMNDAIPGIFNRLDGWVSHSYPNPDFSGSPTSLGRGTISDYLWELDLLKSLGLNKSLPVFITETGWKHSEGIVNNNSYPSSDQVADYFKTAFENVWNKPNIVAVTPFLLDYQQPPFDHFSFKKLASLEHSSDVLAAAYPDYYPQYQAIKDLTKQVGQPVQENKAELSDGKIYSTLVSDEDYQIPLTFTNTGQSIWNEQSSVSLVAISSDGQFKIDPVILPVDTKIEPGQKATFIVKLKAPITGSYILSFQLYSGDQPFDSLPVTFQITIKSPVILAIAATLGLKSDPSGDYYLDINSDNFQKTVPVKLDAEGHSPLLEARYLIPDQEFKFTLRKDYYYPKSVNLNVTSDVNYLDFGALKPDIWKALLNPVQLWHLLPFSK